MNINEAVSFLSDSASKATDAFDIVAGHSRSEGISVFQGKVQNTELAESVGIGIRVFKDNHPGYAHTERLTKEAIAQTLRDAISHCEFTKELRIDLPCPQVLRKLKSSYNSDLVKIELSEMTSLCLDIEKEVFAASKEIENVPYLGAERSESSMIVANSKGVHYEEKSNAISAGIGAVAIRNDVKKMGVYNKGGLDWNAIQAKEIAQKAVEYARELLGASSIVSGHIPVIFSERVAGSIVSMYASSFFAEQVQKGQSRLEGCLGKTIAPHCFTLVNDPFRDDLPGASAFDGEGVATQQVSLVKEGVLKDFLYNLETAARENKQSNGAASRRYSGKVGTSFSNLIVAPGKQNTQDLLKLFPKCLYIVKLEGGSGCSAVSGELSIGAQGFWCENGVVIHPVEGLTLSTNFFDLLQNLMAVGSEYNDHYSSIKVPALAVSDVSVSN